MPFHSCDQRTVEPPRDPTAWPLPGSRGGVRRRLKRRSRLGVFLGVLGATGASECNGDSRVQGSLRGPWQSQACRDIAVPAPAAEEMAVLAARDLASQGSLPKSSSSCRKHSRQGRRACPEGSKDFFTACCLACSRLDSRVSQLSGQVWRKCQSHSAPESFGHLNLFLL